MHHQKLTAMEEEVLWLHSLWHAGSSRNPTLRVNRNSFAINKNRNNRRIIEWPCDPPAEAPLLAAGEWGSWVSAAPKPPNAHNTLSGKELAWNKALQVQLKGISASKQHFDTKESSDDCEEEEDDEGNDHELDAASKHENFFFDIFKKDSQLTDYFKKNYEKGEFFCFACVGVGRKSRKTYGDCMSLVRHANSVTKMKGRGAHKALAKVICQLIGWDVERLPTIIFAVSKESKHSSNGGSNLERQPDCSAESPCNLPFRELSLLDAANNWNNWGNAMSQSPVTCRTPNDKEKMNITAFQEEKDAQNEACPLQE